VDTPTPTTTLSLYIKAGTRYENRHTLSCAQFLKRLAFKGTADKSAIRMVRDLEHLGSPFSADVSREYISYHIQGLNFTEKSDNVNLAIETETLRYILNPLLLEYEVEKARPILEKDANEAQKNHVYQAMEFTHAEGFKDTGLGQPLFPTRDAVAQVTPQLIHSHLKNFYYPGDRMLIIATGVKHGPLVSQLTPLFKNPQLKGKFHELSVLSPLKELPPLPQNTTFTGGNTIRIPQLGNSHLVISFPGLPGTHQDQVILSLLASILGKGNKDLIGPGDSTRTSPLNSLVNSNAWLHCAAAYNIGYSDAGLFAVHSVASPGNGSNHFSAVHKTILSTLGSVTEGNLAQAKRTVKNQFLRGITGCRFKLTEHILQKGTEPAQYLQLIDAVNLNDVKRVAKNLSSSPPLVVAVGDVNGVPKL
jgi:predicted Zn-dependent peptidase